MWTNWPDHLILLLQYERDNNHVDTFFPKINYIPTIYISSTDKPVVTGDVSYSPCEKYVHVD